MKRNNMVILATLGICVYEETKHPLQNNEHVHHEQHCSLNPYTVNVYNLSGRLQYVSVNGAVLAIKDFGS